MLGSRRLFCCFYWSAVRSWRRFFGFCCGFVFCSWVFCEFRLLIFVVRLLKGYSRFFFGFVRVLVERKLEF